MAACALSTIATPVTILGVTSVMPARAASAKLACLKASFFGMKEGFAYKGKYVNDIRLQPGVRPMATSAAREGNGSGDSSSSINVQNTTPEGGVANRPRGRGRGRTDLATPLGGLLDLWDPFLSSRSLLQMMDTVDRYFDDPFYSTPSRATQNTTTSTARTPWDVMEDAEGFKLRVDMPGLSKEEVNVTVEDGTLVIKGEHKAEENDGEDKWVSRSYGSYSTRVLLPDYVQVDKIKAKLSNGVLNVVVPKVKTEKKKAVIDVQVG